MGLELEMHEEEAGIESANAVNILLVDDTPANLVVLESILAKPGQNIVKAYSGREALKTLLKQDFAVILLDVNMPIMNGFETASLIRQRKNSELTPIIFVTADSASEIRRNMGYSIGAVDYIFSPVVPEILQSKISVFVELYRKAAEIRHLNVDLQMQAKMLEQKVLERTQELSEANEKLKTEILEREFAEKELQVANEKLVKLNKIRADFTSMVTHELRTPLSCIHMAIDSLLEGIDGPLNEMQVETLSISKANVERLDKLIDNVLDLSKFESGKMQMYFARNNLKALVSEIHAFLLPAAQRKNINLSLTAPSEDFFALCDADKIRQVLINLTDNAIKFTPSGGRVLIKLCEKAGYAFLEVEDSGIGIHKKDYKKIFQMFGQAGGPLNGKVKGTGIGLAVCKQIAEQHQGKLAVESELGKGSLFSFVFPLK